MATTINKWSIFTGPCSKKDCDCAGGYPKGDDFAGATNCVCDHPFNFHSRVLAPLAISSTSTPSEVPEKKPFQYDAKSAVRSFGLSAAGEAAAHPLPPAARASSKKATLGEAQAETRSMGKQQASRPTAAGASSTARKESRGKGKEKVGKKEVKEENLAPVYKVARVILFTTGLTKGGQLRGLAPQPRTEGAIQSHQMELYAARLGCSKTVQGGFQWRSEDSQQSILNSLSRLFPDIFTYLRNADSTLSCPVVLVQKSSTRLVSLFKEDVNDTSLLNQRSPARAIWSTQALMFATRLKVPTSILEYVHEHDELPPALGEFVDSTASESESVILRPTQSKSEIIELDDNSESNSDSGILRKGKAAKRSRMIMAPDSDDESFLPTRVSSPKASKEKQGFDSNSHVLTDEETEDATQSVQNMSLDATGFSQIYENSDGILSNFANSHGDNLDMEIDVDTEDLTSEQKATGDSQWAKQFEYKKGEKNAPVRKSSRIAAPPRPITLFYKVMNRPPPELIRRALEVPELPAQDGDDDVEVADLDTSPWAKEVVQRLPPPF